MATTRVHHRKSPYDILITRSTKWGNPYVIGRDGSRHEVVELFRKRMRRLKELHVVIIRDMKNRVLGCACDSDEECHGDVYIEICDGTFK